MVLVTHNVEEAILLGQRLIVIGGQPGRLLETVNISESAYRDRYHSKFLELQQHLETVIERDVATKELQINIDNNFMLTSD